MPHPLAEASIRPSQLHTSSSSQAATYSSSIPEIHDCPTYPSAPTTLQLNTLEESGGGSPMDTMLNRQQRNQPASTSTMSPLTPASPDISVVAVRGSEPTTPAAIDAYRADAPQGDKPGEEGYFAPPGPKIGRLHEDQGADEEVGETPQNPQSERAECAVNQNDRDKEDTKIDMIVASLSPSSAGSSKIVLVDFEAVAKTTSALPLDNTDTTVPSSPHPRHSVPGAKAALGVLRSKGCEIRIWVSGTGVKEAERWLYENGIGIGEDKVSVAPQGGEQVQVRFRRSLDRVFPRGYSAHPLTSVYRMSVPYLPSAHC